MSRWPQVMLEGAVAGTAASVLSAVVLAIAGRRETPSAAAPLNATSQWLWGPDEARRADEADGRHTVNGYLVHHGAATFWALLHAAALARTDVPARPAPALAAAAATSALAALVDLRCTPERFTPGFEHRVSPASLVATYGAFAIGLALGGLAVRAARPQGRGDPCGSSSGPPSRRAASLAEPSTATGSLAGKVYSTPTSSTSS